MSYKTSNVLNIRGLIKSLYVCSDVGSSNAIPANQKLRFLTQRARQPAKFVLIENEKTETWRNFYAHKIQRIAFSHHTLQTMNQQQKQTIPTVTFQARKRVASKPQVNDVTNPAQFKTAISFYTPCRGTNSVRKTRYRQTIACPNSPRIEESKECCRQYSPDDLQQRGRFLVWPTSIKVEDAKMPNLRSRRAPK